MINENLNSMLNSMLKTGQTMFPATRPTCRLPTSQQSIDDYLQSFCSRDVMFFDSLALMSGVKRTFGDRHGQEGVGWRPRCVDCDGDNVILKGKTERARLCYDRDDMWVVAMPRRWLCNECNHAFGDYKIRDQLVKARPSLDRLLPHFTEKAAITTRLLDDLVGSATKGMGPSALADLCRQRYSKTYDGKVMLYLEEVQSLIEKEQRLLSYGQLYHEVVINKNPLLLPQIDSNDYRGWAPSSSYLMQHLTSHFNRRKADYDKDYMSRAVDSTCLSLDCSYKVCKWMGKANGHGCFGTLLTGMNEFGEVILNRFMTSDNAAETKLALKSLVSAHSKIEFVSTDKPSKDKPMLQEIFASLQSDAVPQPGVIVPSSKEGVFVNEKLEMFFGDTTNAVALRDKLWILRTQLSDNYGRGKLASLSFDAEWDNKTKQKERDGVDVVQMSKVPEDGNEGGEPLTVYVIHVSDLLNYVRHKEDGRKQNGKRVFFFFF